MTTNISSFCNEFAMFICGFWNKIRTLAEGNNNRIQNGSILMPAAIAPRGRSAASHNQIHQDLVMTGVFFLTLNEWAKKAPFFVSTLLIFFAPRCHHNNRGAKKGKNSMKSITEKWLYTADNKTAGKIVGDVLRIIKKSRAHFAEKFQGYGIAAETLYTAERQGAKFLHLIAHDGEEFRLRIREYIAAAIPATLNPKNGEQLFLSLKWLRWYTHRPAGHINETQPAALGPQYEQPSLFGGG